MFNDGTNAVMPVAPMMNNGGLFGGAGDGLSAIIWLVVIIAIFGGLFNGNGWFGNGGNGNMNAALTRGELCQDMNFSDLSNSVGRLQQSVSDGFANQNQYFTSQVDGLRNQMQGGFDAINLQIVRDGYETRNAAQQNQIAAQQNAFQIITGINDCCCKTQNGFNQVAYQQATDTCAIQTSIANAVRDITENANQNTRTLYDQNVNNRMAQLEQENERLRLGLSQQRNNNSCNCCGCNC